MKIRLMALAISITFLIFSNQLFADVNVLIIGSTKDSGERHNSSVWWNAQKAAFTPNSKPFSPTEVGTQLQSILAQDGRGAVNVTVLDRYRTDANMDTGWQAYSYNLATWFHYPYPAGAEAARWANLRGESGTVWDYVVLIGDPYTMEYTPGMYAQGVGKIAEEVAKGPAQLILLMPWQGSGSSSTVNHYKEVVYRTGRSGGFKVAPGGLAWQACGSPTSTAHPSTAGAYIAAASIYSSIYNQSAAASSYVYNDTHANTTFTTYTNNNSASHYTGAFSFQNPYLILDDKKRAIRMSERGTSTEEGFKTRLKSAMDRSKVTYSEFNDGTYVNNAPTGTVWTTNPMPIDFNYGRDGFWSEDYKSYIANPSYWQLAFGYYYQSGTAAYSVETANDIFIGYMQQQDHDLANRMLNEAPTARNMPTRSLWAQIHKEYPTLNPMRDSTHLSYNWDEAVGTYIYTLFSGRCPLDPKPATDDIVVWTCRKIGYETAWRLGRCQSRAPGFKVSPSAATKKSIIPGEKETMTVQFILPPQQDVTVNISISNSNAAIVGSKQLVFTPQNYDVPQNVIVAGFAGSAASESFNVVYNTTSTDEVYNGLSDTWDYMINRSAPVTLTRVDKGTTQVTANQNLPVTINLNTAGATSVNTVLAGPSRGTTTWSGSNVIYTPGSDFVGKDGFSFATSDGSTLSVGYIEITVNNTVPNGKVSYRGNGSEGGAVPVDSATYAQNATVTALGNTGSLIKTGYNFAGWNIAADGSGTNYNAGSTFSMGASGMILYAKWISAPTYTVTYNANSSNSGLVPSSQIKTDGVNLTLAANIGTLAKNGYTFAGWNTLANGTGTTYVAGGTYSNNANVILYARWTPNNYTVTFNANGGGAPSPANKVVTNASPYGDLATVSYPGFIFNGWFTAATGGTKILPTTTVNISNNQTLHAQWMAGTAYTVSYHANGADSGTVPADHDKIEGVTLTLATNSGGLTRTNYTFAGWNTAADGTGDPYAAGAPYTANAAVTLYAQWALNTYAVAYNGNGSTGGTAPSNQTKTHGINLTLSGAGTLVRAGYTFVNWNTAPNGSGASYAAGAAYTTDAAVTLYAQWTALPTYTVSYNGNGGTGGAPLNQIKIQGVNLTLSGAGTLVRTGYAFANWNTQANGSGASYAAGATYSTDGALALYAQWTLLPTYTIGYNGNGSTGGAAPSNQTKIQGTDLTLSGAGTLVRTGYTFSNWNTAANGSGASYAAGATYAADAPTTLHAQWTINTYVVSYVGNGNTSGTAPTNQTKTYDVNLTLATNTGTLARTGYTFAGWNTQADGLGTSYAVGAAYATNSTLVLYAKWTANSYTVTYDANGGDAPSPSSNSVTFGSTYGALATISRAGYTFNGWFTATSGGTAVTSGTTVTNAANHTLYAHWTTSSYTITFDANGGDTANPTSKSVTYGSTYGTLATTSRAGYTFNGWYTAASGGTEITSGTTVAITSAQTLYAQWALGVLLTWDANGTGADQTNGGGAWETANLWWNGTTNANWQSGASARFGGLNTAGGAVTLAAPTTVENFTFNQFTGTYTLGTAGQTITLNSGIIKNTGSAAVTFVSPITLGAAQTWTNNSTGLLKTGNGTLLTNGGFQLAIDGTGNTEIGQQNVLTPTLSGPGALIKNGTGTLFLGGDNSAGFSGDVTLNNGMLNYGDYPASLGTGNLKITNGILQSRWDTGKTWVQGTTAGTIQITGGESGFASGNGATFNIGAVTWGSSTFNPTKLAFNHATSASGANVKFSSAINLNGATRIITVDGGVAGNARAELTGVISGTGASGLTKEGSGFLLLTTNAATSGWAGNTTVSGGLLHLGAANLANIGGGTGRNISVAAAAGVGFNGLSNAILNRIVETSAEISVTTGTTSNAFDFSGNTGATLPNAFLGTYASNGAKTELSGVITMTGNYRLGAPGLNSGTLGITQSSLLSGSNGLIIGANRVVIVGTHTFTGDTTLRDGAVLGLSGLNTDAVGVRNVSSALQNSVLDLGAPSSTGQIFLEAGSAGGVDGLTTVGNGATTSATFGGLKGSRNLNSAFRFTAAGNNTSATIAANITGFTLNPGSGVSCSYTGTIADFATGTTITKTGLGVQILAGANTYTGVTAITAGKLFINGDQSLATGNTSVSANATLGGTGALGGSATIATNGRLEFNLTTAAASHNPLDFVASKGLTFSGASTLTITSTGGASPGSYTLITGGNNIIGSVPPTLVLPSGWAATVSISGNSLLLNVTSTASTYAVSYNSNSATYGTAPSSQTKTYDVSLTLATNSGNLARTGYSFAGWNTQADGSGVSYTEGATYTANAAVTLYAAWIVTPYSTWSVETFTNSFTDTALTSNPDGDNLTNLQEFAFGMDPTTAVTGSLAYMLDGDVTKAGSPIAQNFAATGQAADFRAVFARRKDHVAAAITYTVQFSADLKVWTVSADSPTRQSNANSAGDIEVVSVPFPASVPLETTGTAAPKFFRVGVSD